MAQELGIQFNNIQIPPEGMERNPWSASGDPRKIDAAKIKDLVVDTITVSPTGYIKSGKVSFTDSTNPGWFQSSLGIYYGSADDNSSLKYTIDTGVLTVNGATIDGTSTIGGRLSSTLATAISASGHFADNAINTANSTILGAFTFGASGALQIGSYVNGVSGDLRISPTGILGRDSSGATTFSINGTTGVAVLNGLVVGTNVGIGTAQTAGNVTTIIGDTVTTGYVNALGISVAAANITGTLTVGTNVGIGSAFPASSAGDLATLDLVGLAQLGSTVVVGGYIKTSLLSADNIQTGTLTVGSGLTGLTVNSGGAIAMNSVSGSNFSKISMRYAAAGWDIYYVASGGGGYNAGDLMFATAQDVSQTISMGSSVNQTTGYRVDLSVYGNIFSPGITELTGRLRIPVGTNLY